MPKKTPTSPPRSLLTADKKAPAAAVDAWKHSSKPSSKAPERSGAGAALPPGLPRRFRVAEVAESFGVRPRTIRSWVEKGLLEREKVGNAVFIRADQIESMLSRRKQRK